MITWGIYLISFSYTTFIPPCSLPILFIRGHNGKVRWAFNFDEWQPTEEEWQQALALVEPVERERIGRFKRPVNPPLVGRTNPDAKSALIGKVTIIALLAKEKSAKEVE